MKKKKTTVKIITVCDIGNYGAISCGHCGHRLDDSKYYKNCPVCRYEFEGNTIGGDFGGSDF